MNGRVYDYNLGRFLSVDPFIQAPGNSQSMNPYSYIMNNPLSGTDPSGYEAKVGTRIERERGKREMTVDKNAEVIKGKDGKVYVDVGNGEVQQIKAIESNGSTYSGSSLGNALDKAGGSNPDIGGQPSTNGSNVAQLGGNAGQSNSSNCGIACEVAPSQDEYEQTTNAEKGKSVTTVSRSSFERYLDNSWYMLRRPFRSWDNFASEVLRNLEALPPAVAAAGKAPSLFSGMLGSMFRGGCSFSEDTLVSTPDGYKPISELKEGDLVYARDDKTGEYGIKPINAVFVEKHDEVIELGFDTGFFIDEEVTTTAEHPFMVLGKGWTPAGELKSGDLIETLDGKFVKLEDFLIVKETQLAYNFEIDEFHTYSVTESELWVHNTCVDDVIKNLRKLKPELCKHGQCNLFAEAAMRALKGAGISGLKVRTQAKNPRLNASIYFDGKSVGDNGFHEWIEVNGKIFDNNVSGVPVKEYLKRMRSTTEMDYKIIEF